MAPSPHEADQRAARIIDAVLRLQGRPFATLDDEVGSAADKTLGRRVLERVLDAVGDIPAGHPAVRTLPLRVDGKVSGPTKMCHIEYQLVAATDFERSHVADLLADVVFVPISKADRDRPGDWCFEMPFRWSPSPDDWIQLHEDYDRIRALIAEGSADALSSSRSAGYGQILHPKTSGRNRDDVETYRFDAKEVVARKRAFFLRSEYTTGLMRDARLPGPHRAPQGSLRAGADLDDAIRRLLTPPHDERGSEGTSGPRGPL